MKNVFLIITMCLFILLPVSIIKADNEKIVPLQPGNFSLKSETGLALPVTDPQTELFGFGGSQTVKAFWGLNRYLDVGPSATFLGLSGDKWGSAWMLGASLQLKCPLDLPTETLLPWVDTDLSYVRTGDLNRFGFAFATGVMTAVDYGRKVLIGPFFRYSHIVQSPERKGYNNRDAQIVTLGVSVGIGSGIQYEKHKHKLPPVIEPPVVVVEEPVIEPPVVVVIVVEEPTIAPVAFDLDQKIQFKKNKTKLRDTELYVLDKIIQLLKDNPDFSVTINGYTSSEGDEEHNLKLSLWRADAVLDYLVSSGIAKERLNSIGLDSSNPIDTNDTKEGRVNNRRVEFVVYLTANSEDE